MASANAGRSSFLLLALLLCFSTAHGQLSETFYSSACPSLNLTGIVNRVLRSELSNGNQRMGASLLRLFFHDCFPQGSLRGFDVIDTIKKTVVSETNCSVSCADILAVAAREAVVILGGPSWTVKLGRRDSLQAFKDKAQRDLPDPSFSLQKLEAAFRNKGFDPSEMVALSGGHAIGSAACTFVDDTVRQVRCTASTVLDPNSTRVPLDKTPAIFDNQYYVDLVDGNGVLNSDRVLVGQGSDRAGQVQTYKTSKDSFFKDFAKAMAKMSEMGVLTGSQGQIRRVCSKLN
nr:unnamed protein product [Digitaria exilis]